MNYWVGAILGLVAVAGIAGFYKLYSAAQSISTDVTGRVQSIGLTGVVFAINAKIKNPTNVKLYILKPFVSIVYKGTEIAKSEPGDEITTIPPFASTQLSIQLTAGYFQLSNIALEFLKKLQNKSAKVAVATSIHVTVVAGLNGSIPKNLKDYRGIYKTIALPVITKDIQL